ncbi:DUF3858 domain-containing protein [Chitinophaga tropicalis]|uniref:DUF3857 domain-containing protein n=1 Tax=Chitinophaga tropicalis TaxID=2683588 RepID=A0A7K1UAD2_9BACT|nr:DUF3858 domain-containing protein [Chitinophaga tropicalis]MVT11266.1 DUF3857 domain-containing protein [Chitinophaga tropicalis]
MRKSIVSPLIVMACGLLSLTAYSQNKKIKFGKVDPEEFSKVTDTSAHAVILSDIGTSEFEVQRDHFEVTFKRHKRIKIVDKNGYDAATVEIPLYISGQEEERLQNLKAVAYNMENGQVVETKMESKSIFTDKLDKNHISKKFTLPAVKEGTIIEYSYSVTSPFYFNLQPWHFQGEYPCLFSEYTVTIPEIYEFVFLQQDINKLTTVKKSADRRSFNLTYEPNGNAGRSENLNVTLGLSTYQWTAQNLPALKLENYTTTLRNHVSKIEFQLSAIKYPNSPVRPVMGTWPKLYEDLNKDEEFGADLDKNNGYLGDVVKELTAGLTSDTAKARRIYNYVRNNFTCTSHSGLYLTKSLKSVFTSHNGNEADLNLLLIAMLRRANLQAAPIILSTRDHGRANPLYPILNRFNYTIACITSDTLTYFLDASRPYLGFGRLDISCYNGHARVLMPEVPAISFEADEHVEQKSTFVMLSLDNGVLKGSFQQSPSYIESCVTRSKIKDKGKEEYFKAIAKEFGAETVLKNTEIEKLEDYEEGVTLKYDFEIASDDANVLYISPMFYEATRTNPFKSMKRTYPVEMPCLMDETYTMNMVLPEGYQVEELPKSSMVKFNETEGVFQYLIQHSENTIQFRCRLKLNKATFAPDEYDSLREFFDMVVKKQAEQIVLKKKA